MKKLITLLLIICSLNAWSQKKAANTDTIIIFKVSGNCEMCKETIEGSLKKAGVYTADWNTKTKMIAIDFDSTKVSIQEIHQWISNSGYDTELLTANDSSYNGLSECCQYKRK